jgi:hypothetical protein
VHGFNKILVTAIKDIPMLRGKIGKVKNPGENFSLESVKLYEDCTPEMDFDSAVPFHETTESFPIELVAFNMEPTLEIDKNIAVLTIES